MLRGAVWIKKDSEISHMAFAWYHSQETWKNVACAEMHFRSVKRGAGLLLQY